MLELLATVLRFAAAHDQLLAVAVGVALRRFTRCRCPCRA